MYKIFTSALLLIATIANAQVDTTDNFDYSKFGEADGVKRYCTQKVLNQTPQKIISIGFERNSSFLMPGVPLGGMLQAFKDENVQQVSAIKAQVNIPVISNNKIISKYFSNFEIESSSEYQSVLDEIITQLKNFDFYQVESVELYLPFEGVNYSDPKRFYVGEYDSVYFMDDWRVNNDLHEWIVKSIINDKISRKFFTSVITKDEKHLVEYFKMKNEDAEEILDPNKTSGTSSSREDKFLKEVNDFITNELENTEWSKHIIELKELLQLDTAPGEQKKKVYNLLAKLKLAKNRNIQFENIDETERQYNYLEGKLCDDEWVHLNATAHEKIAKELYIPSIDNLLCNNFL